MLVFLTATAIVVLAEMGDKTQLLAMAFACRFSARSVLAGVFLATLLNHGLAVAVGNYAGKSLDISAVQSVAAASFILFGLWTLRGDTLHGEEKRRTSFGPTMTVAIAFFIAEMGDKTQLATVALAAKYGAPLAVLLGTTSGMMIADALGIYVGVVAGKGIPDEVVKWTSALIFMGFGYVGLYHSLPGRFVSPLYAALAVAATALAAWAVRRFATTRQPD